MLILLGFQNLINKKVQFKFNIHNSLMCLYYSKKKKEKQQNKLDDFIILQLVVSEWGAGDLIWENRGVNFYPGKMPKLCEIYE